MTTPPKDARPGAAVIARLQPEQAEELAATRDYLLPKDAPVTEAGRGLLAEGVTGPEHFKRAILAIEEEAATAARSDEIDALRELSAAATPGPWKATSRHVDVDDEQWTYNDPGGLGWEIEPTETPNRGQFVRGADAALAAAAVNYVRARLRSEQGERTPRVDSEIDAT